MANNYWVRWSRGQLELLWFTLESLSNAASICSSEGSLSSFTNMDSKCPSLTLTRLQLALSLEISILDTFAVEVAKNL